MFHLAACPPDDPGVTESLKQLALFPLQHACRTIPEYQVVFLLNNSRSNISAFSFRLPCSVPTRLSLTILTGILYLHSRTARFVSLAACPSEAFSYTLHRSRSDVSALVSLDHSIILFLRSRSIVSNHRSISLSFPCSMSARRSPYIGSYSCSTI